MLSLLSIKQIKRKNEWEKREKKNVSWQEFLSIIYIFDISVVKFVYKRFFLIQVARFFFCFLNESDYVHHCRYYCIFHCQMDLETHTRNIWIGLGTLSGLGMIIAFMRTWAWYSKTGREIIDLPVRLYFYFYISRRYHFFFLHRHLVNFFFIFLVFLVLLFFLLCLVFQSGG